jgi:hypothetical protein
MDNRDVGCISVYETMDGSSEWTPAVRSELHYVRSTACSPVYGCGIDGSVNCDPLQVTWTATVNSRMAVTMLSMTARSLAISST